MYSKQEQDISGECSEISGQEASLMKTFISTHYHELGLKGRARWRWIGHINRLTANAIPEMDPCMKEDWRTRQSGMEKVSGKKDAETRWSCGQPQLWSSNRQHWHSLVTALHAT